MRNLKYRIECAQCATEKMCSQPNQKFCSKKCLDIWHGRNRVTSVSDDIASGTIGSITELIVSTDFMLRGYAVFRALSPSCFCDLIAIKNQEILYLEVRTGYLSASGVIGFPKKISTKGGTPTHFAVYTAKDNKVSLIKI